MIEMPSLTAQQLAGCRDGADRELAREKARAAQAAGTAMPLTFGKVFWAIVLGNLFTAAIVGIAYSIVTAH